VSWEDAIAFCEKLSAKTGKAYRLPSEAEWEYACRAETTTPFHFGESLKFDLANFSDNSNTSASISQKISRHGTTDVGKFSPNAFELCDMHGNVMEWCSDYWHPNYDGAPTNGSEWLGRKNNQFRVARGGSWADLEEGCRSAFRLKVRKNDQSRCLGFRIVFPLDQLILD
jgi:formylglycine-generating enzyme required for sulfatase activity